MFSENNIKKYILFFPRERGLRVIRQLNFMVNQMLYVRDKYSKLLHTNHVHANNKLTVSNSRVCGHAASIWK